MELFGFKRVPTKVNISTKEQIWIIEHADCERLMKNVL